MPPPATLALQRYAGRIRALRRADAAAPETALAPAFQHLLEALLPLLPMPPRLTILPEYRHPGIGRPDIALVEAGAPPRAFIELKAPEKPADPRRWRDHDRRQFERFKELAAWATCNFAELRLFERDEERGQAQVVPASVLRPDQSDAAADRTIAALDTQPLLRLVDRLCAAAGHEPRARDARHLATLLAHAARLVRGIVRDRLGELHGAADPDHALLQVRREFRDVLYAHPEAAGYSAADFDALFSAAFAQTLAFGLLLVREGTGAAVGFDAWKHMPEEHPLMLTALRVLTLTEVVRDIGIGFKVMCDTVNSFDEALLVIGADGHDPILYFYEDFLQTFDPEARERYGVYYTPTQVVRFMVGALDRTLRDDLGTEGLRDPGVTILDPATGTGTFLLGIADRVRRAAEADGGAGMAELELRDLAGRMFGFELLIGPYAVAHYRLHHALRAKREGAPHLPRLGVYLADTLAEPGAAAPAGPLGFVSAGIQDERREANRIKAEQPVLAIIGNPPYRRLEEGENRTLVGDWLDGVWDDLKAPVRDAGQGGQLNTFPELSVAFWRWAIWKLFEAENAPRRGVVAFITNRKFLTGWPYAGLRRMLRERFDRIEVIDLRGDVRRGERAGVEGDQGVFNIMVGTAITLAIADGSRAGRGAEIRYGDVWAEGLFTRRAKFEWLGRNAEAGRHDNLVPVEREALGDMRPAPFQNGEWCPLPDLFEFALSGVQTKRDDFVYSVARPSLEARIRAFAAGGNRGLDQTYSPTKAKPIHVARAQPLDTHRLVQASYRPLDTRWLYNHDKFIDRQRRDLQDVWGRQNICLYALPSGTGAGPSVWCHGLLPDYHAFRGSYGGYAFPLYDRRAGGAAFNLSAPLVRGLTAAYGAEVGPEAVFDAILGLLSAASYTRRFAEDLEDTFPHVPFPARRSVFLEAARVGHAIRLVETFARPPGVAYRRPSFCRVATAPEGPLSPVEHMDGAIVLCADGSGRVEGLPVEVWRFAVSGYRVLPRWLEARIGLPADLNLVRDLRDVAARIAELIDLFTEADTVLAAALAEPLTREALGFGEAPGVAYDRAD